MGKNLSCLGVSFPGYQTVYNSKKKKGVVDRVEKQSLILFITLYNLFIYRH